MRRIVTDEGKWFEFEDNNKVIGGTARILIEHIMPHARNADCDFVVIIFRLLLTLFK